MKKYGILLALFLALAACADSDKSPAKDQPAMPEIKTDNLICPQVAILQEAQETFDYGGEKPDPAQLIAKARLKKIDGDCAYRADDKDGKKSGIDISFTLQEAAARGPRLEGAQASFPYFVAVVDPADNILSRQTLTAQFKFSGSDQVTVSSDPLHVFIPLSPQELLAGPDYRVLVGFEGPKS
ncbi:MAG: hypothetical protein P4M13_05290 [Alphaproteobacteria bacterium]|nr:hypothetical protein [Alphaproteobacteria bacterium]